MTKQTIGRKYRRVWIKSYLRTKIYRKDGKSHIEYFRTRSHWRKIKLKQPNEVE